MTLNDSDLNGNVHHCRCYAMSDSHMTFNRLLILVNFLANFAYGLGIGLMGHHYVSLAT